MRRSRSRSRSRKSEIAAEVSGKVEVGEVGFLIGGGDREVVNLGKAQRATNEIEFTVYAFDFFVLIQGKGRRSP